MAREAATSGDRRRGSSGQESTVLASDFSLSFGHEELIFNDTALMLEDTAGRRLLRN